MAIVHKATLSPSKLEAIAAWLPLQPWYTGEPGATFSQVGAFRFDDPDGEVGVQTLLVRAGDAATIYQVPMTYRGAPLAGAESALIAEMAHSVLGPRYVYDGCHDPVFIGELVRNVLTGGSEVDEHVEIDGETRTLPKSMHVRGSGTQTSAPTVGALVVSSAGDDDACAVVRAGNVGVQVAHVLDGALDPGGAETLDATWGEGESACLAAVRVTA